MFFVSISFCAEENTAAPAMEAPKNLTVELKVDEYEKPYFHLSCDILQGVLDLHEKFSNEEVLPGGIVSDEVLIYIDYKIVAGPWNEGLPTQLMMRGLDEAKDLRVYPYDEGDIGIIDIKKNKYSFRVYTQYVWGYEGDWKDKYEKSPYSNTVSIGIDSYYKGASDWATAELDKAAEYGLITDRIKDNMAGEITREEFAEIAVKLYEKYTNKTATVGNASFVDTSNPEILKAANLGLVTGVGNDKYAPNDLITREQMATILLRALKVTNPTTDYSIDGASKFTDDNKIETWAREGVYYCAKAGIVTGVGNNMYDPDGNATREQAVIVCTRAYEKKN